MLPVAYAVSEGTVTDANIQLHGEPSQPGAEVPRGVPRFLSGCEAPAPGPTESGRLELADWLASPRNPLTARVMVNRVWQHHFGRGIVATPSNFGTRGSPPSHPVVARLAHGDVHRARLVDQVAAPVDHVVEDVSARLGRRRGRRSRSIRPTDGTGGSTGSDSTPRRFATRCST